MIIEDYAFYISAGDTLGINPVFNQLSNDLSRLQEKLSRSVLYVPFGNDGFLVKYRFIQPKGISPLIDLGIALMRSTHLRDGIPRIQFSKGNLADIRSLSPPYSHETQQELNQRDQIIFEQKPDVHFSEPLIGTSIVNCLKLGEPKGSLFIIDRDLEDALKTDGVAYNKLDGYDQILSINWVERKSNFLEQVLLTIGVAKKLTT